MTNPKPSPKFSLLFALWDYLNQPLFERDVQFVWNPRKFTISYRSQLLERCWSKDYETEKNRYRLEVNWHNTDPQPKMPDTASSE
ncbi:hypothetical protein D0962_17420 [Leptolyngbyaceae cyanobacterium CCMR0082]|uniref:Uncharacterized protein n=2 Tax=Adonisia turfae TaxID=2950184 RepID=A0A6M0S853_9CYAN|nr:hypothetical protein [Adonisia turfae]NEZ59511.1 hypothetical protein [Adonisia turfae CCMR0081]NEZ64546.1 hypothetical protein [Adonisia turfae CCMR0082]